MNNFLVTLKSRLSKNRNIMHFLVFLLIIWIPLGIAYRNLFPLRMMDMLDFVPWILSPQDAFSFYYYAWSQSGLGMINPLHLSQAIIQSIFPYLTLGNVVAAQQIYYLSLLPLSAITMYIFLAYFTKYNLTKFIVSFVYMLNGMTIVFFQLGAEAFLLFNIAFPLVMLHLIKFLKDNNIQSLLIFTLIIGVTSGFNIYFIPMFMPFIIIFYIFEILKRRNIKYAWKTFILLTISMGIVFLLLLPIFLDQILNIFRYYVGPTKTIGLYSSFPMSEFIVLAKSIYAHPTTVTVFTNLSYLVGALVFLSIFIKNLEKKKYYFGTMIIASTLILIAALFRQGDSLDIFYNFPFLVLFKDPIKFITMIAWSIFLMMALFLDDVEERFDD